MHFGKYEMPPSAIKPTGALSPTWMRDPIPPPPTRPSNRKMITKIAMMITAKRSQPLNGSGTGEIATA